MIAPVATADASARAKLQNIKQFNGFHSCSSCEHTGSTHKSDNGGHSHIYLPTDVIYPERTSDRMILQAQRAITEGLRRRSLNAYFHNFVCAELRSLSSSKFVRAQIRPCATSSLRNFVCAQIRPSVTRGCGMY